MVNSLIKDIQTKGYKHEDSHLNRKVQDLPGHFLVVKDPKIIAYLRGNRLLEKYEADIMRMKGSLDAAIHLAQEDPYSRQLMVFNDSNFDRIKQCFTHMQFMMTHRGNYDMYVYQRAADVEKLKDDLTFFALTARFFETQTSATVPKIVVVYGSIHYKIQK